MTMATWRQTCAAAAGFLLAAVLGGKPVMAQNSMHLVRPREYDVDGGMQRHQSYRPRAGVIVVEQSAKALSDLEEEHIQGTKKLLRMAKAVFIVPDFTRGGLVIGGRAGEGILLSHRRSGAWSGPVFYGLGGATIGLQAGGSRGEVIEFFLSRKALAQFDLHSGFSINADAGFVLWRWSGQTRAGWGNADIVTWSNVAGAFLGVGIGATKISFDAKVTDAYYGKIRRPTIGRILTGKVASPGAKALIALLLKG